MGLKKNQGIMMDVLCFLEERGADACPHQSHNASHTQRKEIILANFLFLLELEICHKESCTTAVDNRQTVFTTTFKSLGGVVV